jgi:hypothetical protein
VAEQTYDETSCGDSLKGGITEKCDSMGSPAEKWLAYFILKVRRVRGILSN